MPDQPLTLSVPGHAELHLTTRSGPVTVTAEDRADVLIESGAPSEDRIERDAAGLISLRAAKPSSALRVRCPAGSDVVVGTISGKVNLAGPIGRVRITTVSASIEVERAETLDVRSVSGNIDVGHCAGSCRLQTKSGRAVCGTTDNAEVSTISGRIQLEKTSGKVRAQSVSGRIEVGTQIEGDVSVRTMSGQVKVAVPRGVRPATELKSMTSRPRVECEEGSDCRVAVRSMSGKILVVAE